MQITKKYTASSLVFALGLPIVALFAFFSNSQTMLGYGVLVLLLLLGEVLAYVFRYRHTGHSLSVTLRSIMFALSWVSVYFWLTDFQLALIYSTLTIPIFFSSRMLLGYGNETVMSTHTILTALGFSVLPFALGQYFSFNSGALTIFVFLWQFTLALSTFDFTPQTLGKRIFNALVLALLGTEVYVALLFLPFHFTAQGLLLILGFYWLWVITFHFLAGALTRKKVQFYSLLAGVLFLITIFSTPWSPL